MRRRARLFSLVAMACSRPALLAPICRWALRALRRASPPPHRIRARVRLIARRGRPVPEVRRAGPVRDRGAWRATAALQPPWW